MHGERFSQFPGNFFYRERHSGVACRKALCFRYRRGFGHELFFSGEFYRIAGDA